MTKQHFMFNGFKLNVEQTHDVAHQLFETLNEFNVQKNELFCGIRYRDHIIGKLKFFIDLYTDMSKILNIDETTTIDNYYAMLAVITRNYYQETLSDITNEYEQFLCNKINEILDLIDSKGLSDIDDIISFISDYDYLNFQEQQLTINCYYASLKNYKIMYRDPATNELLNETDYFDCRKQIAINDYCNEFNCESSALFIQEIEDLLTSDEFYEFLKNYNLNGLDFVLGFEGLKTIDNWLEYTINTLKELNDDLIAIDPNDEAIEINNSTIVALTMLHE